MEQLSFDLEWSLCQARWVPVYRFESGMKLTKGRRSLHYWPLRKATREVDDPCGCYSWWVGSEPAYVGSFSPYSKSEFGSSLEGRLHHYLQSHGKNACPNTNAWVFGNLVAAMTGDTVELQVLRFSEARINGVSYSFETVSKQKAIVLALESMLIASYRLSGGCSWNRAG